MLKFLSGLFLNVVSKVLGTVGIVASEPINHRPISMEEYRTLFAKFDAKEGVTRALTDLYPKHWDITDQNKQDK